MSEYDKPDPIERFIQEDERRLEISKVALAREIMDLVGCSYEQARENIEKLLQQQKQRTVHNEIEITEENI